MVDHDGRRLPGDPPGRELDRPDRHASSWSSTPPTSRPVPSSTSPSPTSLVGRRRRSRSRAPPTDAEDGTIPASGLHWVVGLLHCGPSDCHEHTIAGRSTASRGGTIDGARPRLPVEARAPSVGDRQPRRRAVDQPRARARDGDRHRASEPAGVPITVGDDDGARRRRPRPLIRGGSRRRSRRRRRSTTAPTAYRFGAWSDGAPPAIATSPSTQSTTLTARYVGRRAGHVCEHARAASRATPGSRSTRPATTTRTGTRFTSRRRTRGGRHARRPAGRCPLELYGACDTLLGRRPTMAGTHVRAAAPGPCPPARTASASTSRPARSLAVAVGAARRPRPARRWSSRARGPAAAPGRCALAGEVVNLHRRRHRSRDRHGEAPRRRRRRRRHADRDVVRPAARPRRRDPVPHPWQGRRRSRRSPGRLVPGTPVADRPLVLRGTDHHAARATAPPRHRQGPQRRHAARAGRRRGPDLVRRARPGPRRPHDATDAESHRAGPARQLHPGQAGAGGRAGRPRRPSAGAEPLGRSAVGRRAIRRPSASSRNQGSSVRVEQEARGPGSRTPRTTARSRGRGASAAGHPAQPVVLPRRAGLGVRAGRARRRSPTRPRRPCPRRRTARPGRGRRTPRSRPARGRSPRAPRASPRRARLAGLHAAGHALPQAREDPVRPPGG